MFTDYFAVSTMKKLPVDSFKSKEDLENMPTKTLYRHFKFVRAIESCIYSYAGPRCCEICKEYIGDDFQKDVLDVAKPYEEYKLRIKKILDSRPDQFTFDKKPKKKQKYVNRKR